MPMYKEYKEQNKSDVRKYRTQIRSYLFSGVSQSDGSLKFYSASDISGADQNEGKTWRLRVGYTPLETGRLHMTGGGEVVGKVPPGLPAFSLPGMRSRDRAPGPVVGRP